MSYRERGDPLHTVIAANRPIYIAEAEEDADAIHGKVRNGIFISWGGDEWRDSRSDEFRDALDLSVFQREDEDSRKRARHVHDSLWRAGVSPRVIKARTGSSAGEHFAAGHTVAEFVEVKLAAERETPAGDVMRSEELPPLRRLRLADEAEAMALARIRLLTPGSPEYVHEVKTLALVEAEQQSAKEHLLAIDESDRKPKRRGELEFPSNAMRGTFEQAADYLRPVTGANIAHIFATWWTTLAVCIGRSKWGTWSGRVVPLVYAATIGRTGDHKTTAADYLLELLPENVTQVDGVTSDAGLFDVLDDERERPVLLRFDELGFLFRMAGLSGSTLDSMLNRLWGAPARLDRNLSRRNRDGGTRRVDRPFVCLLGGTHPETFWRTVADPTLAISSGFLNRLAVFVVEQSKSLALTAAPDDALARSLRDHLVRLRTLPAGEVRLSSDAEIAWRNYSVVHDHRVASLPLDLASITKRIRDHVARLALAFAVDQGRATVHVSDLEAAKEVGAYLEESYKSLLLGRQPDRGPERASSIEAIALRILEKRPNVLHSARDVIHSWPNSNRPSTEELRRVLGTADGVESRPGVSGQKMRYKHAG